MAIKEQITLLLNKKMDRQDFLKHVAIGVVAVSGAGAVLRLLVPKPSSQQIGMGYGSSAYGGAKNDIKQT